MRPAFLLLLYPFAAHIAVHFSQPNFALNLLYFPPILISLLFLISFAKTLLPGREPLITQLARVIYSDISTEVKIYTRRVTIIWSLFFSAILMETILLALFADIKIWSLFCNILNYIFIAVLFLSEYVYRKLKFKNQHSFFYFLKQMIKTDIRKLPSHKILLLGHKDLQATFAYKQDKAITCLDFLNDVYAVMQQLPSGLYLINLCEDRYYFTVLFAAAMLKKKITLLPNNRSPHAIAELQKNFSDSFCLDDSYISNLRTSLSIDAIPEIDSSQLVAILYTSGSTGTPVPCEKTWGELANHCVHTAASLHLTKHDKVCVVATVSPQHMYGLEHSVILPMQMGFALSAEKPFFMDDIRAALQKNEEVVLFSTPLQLKQCVNTDVVFPKVRLLVSSTAALETSLAIQLEEKFNTALYEIYGCTEAGCVATRQSTQTETWTLSDDYQLSDVLIKPEGKIKLLDDIEKINERHFILKSRLQDNINIAGNRMSLSDLNIKLTSIPGVEDGIFYFLDPRLIAFVVAKNLSDEEIKSALRQMLNPVFLPRKIIRVDKLPRNEMGKINGNAIKKLIPMNFTIANTHMSLPGHFPDNPVVPGVVILQHVMENFKKYYPEYVVRELINVKFKYFLEIDVQAEIFFKENSSHQFDFQIKQKDKLIARGLLMTEDLT